MKSKITLTGGEKHIVEIPDWIKTLDDLELYQGWQRQLFLEKQINKYLTFGDNCNNT